MAEKGILSDSVLVLQVMGSRVEVGQNVAIKKGGKKGGFGEWWRLMWVGAECGKSPVGESGAGVA